MRGTQFRRPAAGAGHPPGPSRLDLRVPAAARFDAAATSVGDPAELLEDLLAVGYPAADFLDGLRCEQERGFRHEDRRLATRIVETLHEAVVDGAGRRNDLRR